jgi:glycosyltransferase involved in cell wall biosynthesis
MYFFVSTATEYGRDWKAEWGNLSVTVQKSWKYATRKRYEGGFALEIWWHFPYDTLPVLIRERPDVVISVQLGFRTSQAAIYRRLFPKSRLIIWNALSEHTEKGLPGWRVLQRKLLLRMADAVLVDGASGIRYLQSLGVPREEIFPLPYCAKIAPQLKLPLERELSVDRRLLYVGRLIELKGLVPFLGVLVDWLRKHPGNSCEFWIAGDGPFRGELEKFQGGPRLQLRLLGGVAYEELIEVYAQGGIFVFPSLADEWGVVVNEALAAGLPVLGSRYSQAVEELVQDGVNGWTFRPDHPEEMYAAVDRAMTASHEELEGMRRGCREGILRFAPEYGAKHLLAAIDFVRGVNGAGESALKASADGGLRMDAAPKGSGELNSATLAERNR